MIPAAFAMACGQSKTEPSSSAFRALTPVATTADWPSASPESQNLDVTTLQSLTGRIARGDYGSITSVLIARRGQLVVEEYFGGWSAGSPHTMQSVSKSVTSLLAGLAIDRGFLALNSRIVDAFPDYAPVANLDERKQSITVRDLLMMQAGFDWSESTYTGSPLERLNTCQCDWIRFVLDWPMRDAPGTRWEYNSGGVITLGAIVGRATSQPVNDWARSELFGPLDVQGQYWFVSGANGLPHTGGGLNLRPRDAAKIGQVVLGNGRWRGRQIVSASWIAESTAPLMRSVRTFGSRPVDYGYLWWQMPGGIITASGSRGQWIFIVPDKELVVATTAEADQDWLSAPDFLYSYILPAAR